MARVTKEKAAQSREELLDAARAVLISDGFASLSTRRVAESAGTQMSQIQYHFGSKEGMLLALFEDMNARLIARQRETFDNRALSIADKWRRACDYLEDDVASGYVRVLQELIAVGWSNPTVGAAVKTALAQWKALLAEMAEQLQRRHGPVGPFEPDEIAELVSAVFIGAEALILLGDAAQAARLSTALRRVGDVIAQAEHPKRGD